MFILCVYVAEEGYIFFSRKLFAFPKAHIDTHLFELCAFVVSFIKCDKLSDIRINIRQYFVIPPNDIYD